MSAPVDEPRLDQDVEACQEFESLAGDLLTRFTEVPAADVDAEITAAQKRVCELFRLDLSSLWQLAPGSRRAMTLTHLYRPAGGPPVPERADAGELFPWCLGEVLARRSFFFTSADDFPPEAARDRELNLAFGLKSFGTVPLSTGGGPVLGALNFATTAAERPWPDDVVRRLRLVGRIFAAALGRKAEDEALRETEARLQLAAESAGAGLWKIDLATSAVWLTDPARRHLDLPQGGLSTLDEILARVFPGDRGRIRDAVQRARETAAETSVEYRVRGEDGRVRWLSSTGRARGGRSEEAGEILGVTLDVTDRKRTEEAYRDLSRRLIQAHEEERGLVARQLHDDLSQRLAVLAIALGRDGDEPGGGSEEQALGTIREDLVRLSDDIHAFASQLRPPALAELGLAEALRAECGRAERLGTAEVLSHLEPTPAPGADAALCLFRVAQEALRNAVRHARARTVTVSLRAREAGLLLTVADDGVGFDPVAPRRRSLGLASMGERVQLVGGTLRIESRPGEGTAIHAWVPGSAGADNRGAEVPKEVFPE